MGWLDNSTNNIILDAVLTDYGRQALARNDGSFQITKFSLGDDEIDYSIITKYGRTIGREKIEKNTPIFEAFTNQNLGLKYKMMSSPLPLLHLPKVTLTSPSSGVTLNSTGNGTSVSVTVTQTPTGPSSAIDPNLQDTMFDVYVPDMFLSIAGQASIGSPDVNKIAFYSLGGTIPAGGNPKLEFIVQVKSISSQTFDVYGKVVGSNSQILTQIRVIGKNSGSVLDIPVTITKV